MPAGLSIVLAVGFCCLLTAAAVLVGPTRPSRPQRHKLQPFECGSDPIGDPRGRYSVKFYQVAILFLVFDIEAAFMYPWAVKYKELSQLTGPDGSVLLGTNGQPMISMFGFVEMLLFVVVLVVALAYVWRKKAIGWD